MAGHRGRLDAGVRRRAARTLAVERGSAWSRESASRAPDCSPTKSSGARRGTASTRSALDVLTSSGCVPETVTAQLAFTFDGAGRMIGLARWESPQGSSAVVDDASALAQVTPLAAYSYGADDLRTRVRALGGAVASARERNIDVYNDGLQPLVELEALASSGASPSTLARYHYDVRGLMAITGPHPTPQSVGPPELSASLSTRYVHLGALGTTLATSAADSAPGLHSYRTDPWGALTSGLDESDLNASVFTGHQTDLSGYVYMKARYYDPLAGRFLSQDSYLGEIGAPASMDRYLYGLGNPLGGVDPDGRLAAFGLESRRRENQVVDATNLDGRGTPSPVGSIFVAAPGDANAVGPQDPLQGHLADCYLIASMAAVAAAQPQIIHDAIEWMGVSPEGMEYEVTLFRSGRPVRVRVRDRSPGLVGGTPENRERTRLYARSSQSDDDGLDEGWVILLENAAAGLAGGYEELAWGYPAAALRMLTGWETSSHWFWFRDDSHILETLDGWLRAGSPVVFQTGDISGLHPLSGRHAYAVIGVDVSAGEIKFVNPWDGNTKTESLEDIRSEIQRFVRAVPTRE